MKRIPVLGGGGDAKIIAVRIRHAFKTFGGSFDVQKLLAALTRVQTHVRIYTLYTSYARVVEK